MLCHIHPPPGRSSRHPAAGLADSRQDGGGAFGNSFTGDAFCGTSSFILAGHGTGGQCRSCEMPVPASGRETDRNTRSACLAEISLTTKRRETRSSLPRFHVILLPHRPPSFNSTAPRSFGPVVPSKHITRPSICRKRFRPSRRHFFGFPRAAHAPRFRPVSSLEKIGRKTAHDARYHFVPRRHSVISSYRYPASRPSASPSVSPLGISLFGRAFRSGSPQRKSLPLWPPRH